MESEVRSSKVSDSHVILAVGGRTTYGSSGLTSLYLIWPKNHSLRLRCDLNRPQVLDEGSGSTPTPKVCLSPFVMYAASEEGWESTVVSLVEQAADLKDKWPVEIWSSVFENQDIPKSIEIPESERLKSQGGGIVAHFGNKINFARDFDDAIDALEFLMNCQDQDKDGFFWDRDKTKCLPLDTLLLIIAKMILVGYPDKNYVYDLYTPLNADSYLVALQPVARKKLSVADRENEQSQSQTAEQEPQKSESCVIL